MDASTILLSSTTSRIRKTIQLEHLWISRWSRRREQSCRWMYLRKGIAIRKTKEAWFLWNSSRTCTKRGRHFCGMPLFHDRTKGFWGIWTDQLSSQLHVLPVIPPVHWFLCRYALLLSCWHRLLRRQLLMLSFLVNAHVSFGRLRLSEWGLLCRRGPHLNYRKVSRNLLSMPRSSG